MILSTIATSSVEEVAAAAPNGVYHFVSVNIVNRNNF